MSVDRRTNVLDPFKVAMHGLVYTFRTQRHLRFHLYVVLVLIPFGIFMNLGFRELMVLLFTVTLVILAEMFNSAIEATVDLVQPSYHPLAKFAKDISAGAVLITTFLALVVGSLLIFGEGRWEEIKINLTAETPGANVFVRIATGLLTVFLITVVGKGLGKRGQVLQGGLVSGHSAFGFFLATSIMLISDQVVVSAIAITLAAIIAQSRWEAKIHSVFEVSLGAAVGVVVGLLFFGLMPK